MKYGTRILISRRPRPAAVENTVPGYSFRRGRVPFSAGLTRTKGSARDQLGLVDELFAPAHAPRSSSEPDGISLRFLLSQECGPMVHQSPEVSRGDQGVGGPQSNVVGRARPFVFPWHRREAGTYRIALDVANRSEQVSLVKRTREKPVLEQVSTNALSSVDSLRKSAMRFTDRRRERSSALWHRDQVNVISHEAIRQKLHAGRPGLTAEQAKVRMAIRACEEYRL